MQNTHIRSRGNAAPLNVKLFTLVILALMPAQTNVRSQTLVSDVLFSRVDPVVPPRMFYARNYGGKCLDFGAPPQVRGSPVYLFSCNGTVAQQLRIVEINDRHEVRLYAGNKVVGIRDNGLREAGVSPSSYGSKEISLALQLQNEANLNTILARNQIFALDGDSIIWAANRSLVVKVQNARGSNRTPLVLGQRNFSDEEFWDLTATDTLEARPTAGFVRVTQASEFVNRLNQATWGSVIEVGNSIDLRHSPPLEIGPGVTIRGDRRRTNLGPEFLGNGTMFILKGNYARVTGLRLRGPSRSTAGDQVGSKGVVALDRFISYLDHNDISDWTVAAVEADNDGEPNNRVSELLPSNTRILRNFIHHNQQDELGYGVAVSGEAFPLIEGNTFLNNRHAIAGDGTEFSGYRARLNLVQYEAPDYGFFLEKFEHDFDMHGLRDTCGHRCGGIAGFYMEIGRNTFLGGNRINFHLRGTPVKFAEFHANVLVGSQGDAIENSGAPSGLILSSNRFSATNPTGRLGVGDFDGDGKDDLFLATGAAWYYASAGNAEWRFINAQSDSLTSLRFGDFDNDGRTDVFAQHGSKWDISWGGISKWETINSSGPLLQDFTIGDFVGDRRADVFYADGQTWYISDGGVGPFTPINTSSFRVPALRFGDFNADGKTDVFSVVSRNWMVSYSGTSAWTYLRPKLTGSVSSLTVADFNGDGRADLATTTLIGNGTLTWKVSYGGISDWQTLRTDGNPVPTVAAIGRFDGNRSADMLRWNGNYLDISASGSGTAQRHSRQDMR